jgi:signal transduction histidine kinase
MFARQRRAALSLIDVVLAGALTAGALTDVASLTRRAPAVLAICLSVACTSSVAWRRRAPAAAAFVAATAMLAYHLATADPRMTFEPYAVVFCYYMLGRRLQARNGRLIQGVLLGYALATLAPDFRAAGSAWAGDVAGSWMLFAVLPCGLGVLAARHAAMTRELAANMTRLKGEQERRAQRAASDERNRVARELHDVIAHCVSVMVIQASAARLVAASDAGAARAALQTVGASGREAMADLRRVMGVLRRGDDDPAGLAQLNTLIKRARDAGVPAQLRVQDPPEALPAALDLVVYRVVQEALTNVVKHAGPARADVQVRFHAGMIDLTITDTGTRSAPELVTSPVSGHGLVGMRERLALYGGRLDAGPRADGGYAVHARIPMAAAAPARKGGPSGGLPAGGEVAGPRPWSGLWLDPLLAGAWLVALEAEALTSSHRHGPLLLNVLVVGAMALAGLWRRRVPLVFLFVTGMLAIALSQGLTSRDYATVTGTYSVLIPTYAVGAWEKRSRAATGIATWACAATVAGVVQHAQLSGLAGPLLAAGAAWSAGRVIRAQRELAAKLRGTSARLAAEREDRARLAVASERARIARDLHALVARGVIAMVVQAEAAQNLLEADPSGANISMSAIEDTGRDALSEMRRMLGVLRNGEQSRELRPQPGLDQIHALLQRSRESGQPVEFTIEGEPGALFAGVDMIAYRILEEVLGSTHRRPGGPVTLTLRFGGEELELDFRATGSGLRRWPTPGMRERIAICDGQLTLSSGDDRGSRMTIRLPRGLQAAPA